MAGDWIKMRTDLLTSPKVVRIASALKADRLRVTGGLFAVWCLFDTHSVDGTLDGYTAEAVDELIAFPGFSSAMIAVGWLSEVAEGLAVPRFDEHNGQSAKRRAQEADRKREVRKASAPKADKVRTREEKRREDVVVTAEQQQRPDNVVELPTPDDRTGFAKAVACEYAKAYGIATPPVPLMLAMEIAARVDFYAPAGDLTWWTNYFAICWEDLFLTDRSSTDQPLGQKASSFRYLVSEKCMADLIDRSKRDAAHG